MNVGSEDKGGLDLRRGFVPVWEEEFHGPCVRNGCMTSK